MTITSTPPPAGHKLAIADIFGETFTTCWRLKGKLLGVSVWPLLFGLATIVISVIALGNPIVEIAQYFAWAAIFTLFAVAWHRLVLLDSGAESSAPTAWRRSHTAFFGYQLLMYVLMAAFFLPVVIPAMLIAPEFVDPAQGQAPEISEEKLGMMLALMLGMIVLFVFYYYVLFRLCFVFPARAVGERYSLADSWRHTRGNGWRLIAISLLVNIVTSVVIGPLVLILLAIIGALVFVGGGEVTMTTIAVSAVLFGVVYTIALFIALALNVSLISLAFRSATGWVPGPPPPATPAQTIPPVSQGNDGT